jgi:hypothetical protein
MHAFAPKTFDSILLHTLEIGIHPHNYFHFHHSFEFICVVGLLQQKRPLTDGAAVPILGRWQKNTPNVRKE